MAGLAGSGFRSENGQSFERGLYSPLPDPTELNKVSHSCKLLCQSSQEQLPVRGITSAYRQKCCRTSTQSDLSRVFQPTVSGPQAQQQMEANTRPEQTKSLPQSGEIQNGNSGNHQNIPPTRGVGHVGRLQRCLLPYSNTGTIQEISQISYPGSDLPIQSTAFRSVYSTHGVHCSSQGGETDGQPQGYKNPPVPRRLVGEGKIIPSLPPAYTDSSKNVSGPRLAGEQGKIRAGAKTNFQLRRLPVRPQVRPVQTDTGPVGKLTRENISVTVTTGLSGPTVHVPHRPVNGHGEASSPWPATHATPSVASQKQLEGTGISRKDYPSSQVFTPTLAMVAKRKQCATRSTVTPSKACSADIYRRLKRRVGRSLK